MGILTRAHKIRLNPTPEQEAYFCRACGTRRFVFNYGLAEWQKQYKEYKDRKREKPPSALSLKKDFNAIREKTYPWTYDVTKCVIEGAFDDLGKAYANFLEGRAKYPKFKKKGKSRESFYLANDKFTMEDHQIQIPVMGDFIIKQRESQGATITGRGALKKELGWVNMAENLRYGTEHVFTEKEKRRHTRKLVKTSLAKIMGATVSKEGNHWYVSIQVQVELSFGKVEGPSVGVDVGLSRLATLSDGTEYENPKHLRHALKRLRFLNKELARRQKGSKNWHKTRRKLAALHEQIANMRNDALQKLSYTLGETYGFIGIETLNVRGMLKNHKLALSLSDASLGKLIHLIQAKAGRHETPVILVDRFFPSTKRCHQCHHVRDIELEERTYVCFNPGCRWTGDRDWNASMNILQEALRMAGRVA
jgi:putative transposase